MSGTGCEGASNPLTCPPTRGPGPEPPTLRTVDADGCHGYGSSSRPGTHVPLSDALLHGRAYSPLDHSGNPVD
ncbi:hypothetical protein TNIN_300011 [Trichonephila inaurata madagascariensis]|uniref:Uncharacterized protein n=1 Tax=Trichonephila inaurata madagascariensis TaxID=2747483 RepID=A0A8X6XB94_9ARAC|nr:hypothetical protein TNIN_300011 [Trichonephila inaurata madagascariensis]